MLLFFEEYDRWVFPEKLKLIVDAGAHVGLYSIKHASIAQKVIAIEPIPFNYKLLRININLNKLSNVYPSNVALWRERRSDYGFK